MYDANVIALFPSIGNFFRAECFRQNMLEIGKDVTVEKQIFYQTKVAETLKKGDLAIVISYANRTPHVEDFIRVMNKNQVTTVLISSTKESELCKFFHRVLPVKNDEVGRKKPSHGTFHGTAVITAVPPKLRRASCAP